ncbi:uncharacterized protein C19orf44 homolog [Alosa sapidissima]|uniref:uncharacterized protein C19orf44 homolog n=1 Tax=Alosa sapidissima TaxID=34773 RepID=UPI001C08C832|nr:uncharacterized protein C19orf44 homolog [Alosa sapidissima]
MWKQGGGRNSALDRAMAQLAAKRVASAGSSQINENASPQTDMNLKSILPHRQMEFQDLSDISSEDVYSEDHNDGVAPIKTIVENDLSERSAVGGGSRFLKKTTNTVSDRQSSAPSSHRLSTEEPVRIPQRRAQSAALNRLAQLEQRFKHRKEGSNAQASSPGPPNLQEDPLSAHSSSDLTMKGERFLKKVTSSVPEQSKQSQQSHVPQLTVKAPLSKFPCKGVSLDSDEEDMERLLGGSLSSSAESPGLKGKSYKKNTKTPTLQVSNTFRQRTPRPPSSEQASPVHSLRSVSIVYSLSPSPPNILTPSRRSPKVRFLRPSRPQSSASINNEIKSLEELFTDTDETISERSAASDGFKLNVMTLDDLIPAEPLGLPASSKMQVGVAQDISRGEDAVDEESECTLDDIFPEDKDPKEEAAVEYESDFESDMKSEVTYQSVSEIPEHLTDDDKSEAADYQSTKHRHYSPSRMDADAQSEQSLADRSEMDSRQSFESYGSQGKDSSSRSYTSYSRSETLTPTSEPRRNHVKEAAVQTEKGLAFTLPSRLDALASTYMDPTPVSRYTVSAEALEALTSQKPVEAALNDMLKQQLALTRHFVESSRHLYSSLLQSLETTDYKYTTLEDTKEYIRKHRPPKLTMEEALEEVQREMREYHYL